LGLLRENHPHLRRNQCYGGQRNEQALPVCGHAALLDEFAP
jgi:hypothetical protein